MKRLVIDRAGEYGEQPGVCAGPAALLLVIFLLVPLSAFGDAGDFFPTIYSTEGYLELNMQRQSNENTSAGNGTRTADSFALERLRLYLDGYLYHPRFMQFLVRGAGGLSQERYDGNQVGTSYTDNALATDYEFRTKILPEHPYNLELYTLRTTPLLRQSTAETRPLNTEKGVIFNYANRPFFFNLSYNTGETKTRVSSSEFRTSRANGSYSIGPFDNYATYSNTDSSTSFGLHNVNDYSSFENTLKSGSFSLSSKLNDNRTKQSSPFSASLDTDAFSWLEQVSSELPWNFSTSASYALQKNKLITEETPSEPQKEAITETKTSNFTLAHKLYESVRTTYSLSRTLTETSTGDTKNVINSLSGVYTKKIPDGRFTINVQGSRSLIDQENAPLIMGETHNVPLFGTFTLLSGRLDTATISIRVISDTGALIDLSQNNYVIQPSGNLVDITIESLPPLITAEGHGVQYPYAFLVTYTLLAGTVELEMTTVGYTVNLALFNNLVNPYYGFQHTVQAVLAGSIPGGAQDTKTEVTGVVIQKAPYSFVTEQRIMENDFSPSRSLRNAVEYAKMATETLNVSAKAEHTKTIYGQGASGTVGYTEQVSSLNVMFMKTVPRQKLMASLGGSYSQRRATIDSDQYSIIGNLTWKAGALLINMGAILNRAGSTGVDVTKQTIMSEYYYLNVSRKLF